MKRNWIITIVLAIIIIGIALAVYMYYGNTKNKGENEDIVVNQLGDISEKITDECTDEWEHLDEEARTDILQTNSNEEKISPNCLITIKEYYDGCKHTTKEYIDVPSNLVNKTKDDLKELYKDYTIEKFSKNDIILYKENEGECGEHYILKDDNGKITIYIIDEQGEEKEFQKTEIAVDYLTETDKVNIKNGIKIYGNESLNQIIEDFE